MGKLKPITLAIFALATAKLAATPADDAAARNILLFDNGAEVPTLDPQLNTSVNGSRVVSALMEGLIAYHPSDDNIPEPGVAESWEHDGKFTTWTFHLREDARWSNGDPVTARDFAYSYERMLNPALGARYAELLYMLRGAREFNQDEVQDFREVGVKVIDDYTLQLELNGPTPYFLNMLKHSSWFPVHPPTIEKYGGMTKPDTTWFRDEYVGNGPFRIDRWDMNQIIVLKPSPTYWDADKVSLAEIHFFPLENISTASQMFSSGELHYDNTIPPPMIPIYKERNDPNLRTEPYLGTYFFRLNTTVGALSNKLVRQALSLAVNRRAIVTRVTKGGQEPGLSFTPPGIQNYQPPTISDFNPKKARELLAEAGYPRGEGFPKLTLLYNTSEAHKDIAEAVQQMWQRVLGIEIEIRNQEWRVFISTTEQLDYEIARAAWIGDYVYPDTFLFMWRTGDGNNQTGWGSPEYDRLIAKSLDEIDPDKRLALLKRAETILLDELPIIPIYYYSRIYRIDPRVTGWHPKLLDNHNWKYIGFE